MIILGIESSCDETAASIVDKGKILSNSVYTQVIHKSFGGVVPEVASREHEIRIISVVKDAFKKGLLPNSLTDDKYFNIKRMQSIKLN